MALTMKKSWKQYLIFSLLLLLLLLNVSRILDFFVDSGVRLAERRERARDMGVVSVVSVDGGVRDLGRPRPDLAPPPQMWFERGPVAEGSGKRVALTFDDGPCGQTSVMLDMLCAHHVKATFFLIGANVKRCPEDVKRIRAEGHDIGLHGFEHLNLKQQQPADESVMNAQVMRSQDILAPLIGYRPMIFRPPFGGWALNDVQKKWLVGHGIATILWSVDSGDSGLVHENASDPASPRRQLNAEEIERTAMSHMHDGAIVLLHSFGGREGRSATVTAASSIITRLKEQGYSFVTVSQLIGTGRPPPLTVPSICQTPADEIKASDGGVGSTLDDDDSTPTGVDPTTVEELIKRL